MLLTSAISFSSTTWPIGCAHDPGDLVAHAHIADAPGRHEPGIGFTHFLSMFEQTGFDRLIGCEYKPLGRTVDGLRWREHYA